MTGLEGRIDIVRATAFLDDLAALLGAPGNRPQAAVRAEAAKQQDALERVAEAAAKPAAEAKAELAAMAVGKQAHTRSGVGTAIRAALAGLGAEAPEDGADAALTGLDIDALRARYVEVVGRETSSTHRGYLIRKIREALKGRVTVGAVQRAHRESDEDVKVLPLRIGAEAVEAMDGAWKRLGYASRMAFLRAALAGHLKARGEDEAARLMALEG